MPKNFDELNILHRSLSYDDYFDPMDLEDDEKENRKKLADELEEIMLIIFSLFLQMEESGYMDSAYIVSELEEKYRKAISRIVKPDWYILNYIRKFSKSTVQTTLENIKTEYFLSRDRAVLISENESGTIYNYKDYLIAISDGKTRKQWKDMKDDRERETHLVVGGSILPINDYFTVGNSLMLYPRDYSQNPEAKETVNCRCTIIYF